MTLASDTRYAKCVAHARETALLGSIESVLGWDERTQMPAAAGAYRAEQMTLVSGLVHERWTSAEFADLLHSATEANDEADPAAEESATLRELGRQRDRRIRLPKRLVEEITRATVLAQQAWVEARAANDFAGFRPHLEHVLSLKREEADTLGYERCRYDALLEDYEPGAITAEVAEVLSALEAELVPLVAAIVESRRQPDRQLLARAFPVDAQERFARAASAQLGFDYDRGRLDVSAHPFCSGLGPHDCRLTTRYDEHDFNNAFFGVLHEAGHGMYEQGLPDEHFGLPLGSAVSLGIHESQSRLWENLVGRSRAFWQYFFPRAQREFGAALAGVDFDDFYFAVNDVRRSLIRTEADEATYNLHICVRFELERALLDGGLAVADLPAAWNERYAQRVGVRPDNNANGVLQDIHWSAGLFGYFPTYTLGNLYAAQFFRQAVRDTGGMDAYFSRGEFRPLLDWLRDRIHGHGQRFSAPELVERVTGEPLSHQPLMAHLRGKLEPLYGLH